MEENLILFTTLIDQEKRLLSGHEEFDMNVLDSYAEPHTINTIRYVGVDDDIDAYHVVFTALPWLNDLPEDHLHRILEHNTWHFLIIRTINDLEENLHELVGHPELWIDKICNTVYEDPSFIKWSYKTIQPRTVFYTLADRLILVYPELSFGIINRREDEWRAILQKINSGEELKKELRQAIRLNRKNTH